MSFGVFNVVEREWCWGIRQKPYTLETSGLPKFMRIQFREREMHMRNPDKPQVFLRLSSNMQK
jgi:hypothetical protein